MASGAIGMPLLYLGLKPPQKLLLAIALPCCENPRELMERTTFISCMSWSSLPEVLHHHRAMISNERRYRGCMCSDISTKAAACTRYSAGNNCHACTARARTDEACMVLRAAITLISSKLHISEIIYFVRPVYFKGCTTHPTVGIRFREYLLRAMYLADARIQSLRPPTTNLD